MTDVELVTAVRSELGKLAEINTVDIESSDITREAAFILSRISSRLTKKVMRSITTTVDVREYSVDTNTIRVQEVLSSSEVEEMEMKLGSYIVSGDTGQYSNEYYNFPSLWVINQVRRRRGLLHYLFEFHPLERKLKLDPCPKQTGEKVWYISIESAGWNLGTVPADFEELLVRGTTWKCLEIVALRRSTEGGIERGGGRVDYPADSILRHADTVKTDFYEELDIKVKLHSL